MRYDEEFGERVKHLRKMRGMTQGELAERIDCCASYISRIEKYGRLPCVGYILALANTLGTPIDQLLNIDLNEEVDE